MSLYARARALWGHAPDATALIRQQDVEQWDQALYEQMRYAVGKSYLGAAASAGAVTVTAGVVPAWMQANAGHFIVVDPYTVEAELRHVTGVSGTTLTLSSALTYAHAVGDSIIRVGSDQLIPWTMFGAVPGSSTAPVPANNVLAFNRLASDLHVLTSATGASWGIFIPAGIFYVNNELKPENGQTIAGVSIGTSNIIASSGFPFDTTGEVAVIHPYRDGSPVIYDTPGPSARWDMHDFYVSGNNIANSNGILVSPQQPGHIDNLRVDNCAGKYGLCVADCQQVVMNNMEFIGNAVALRYRSVEYTFVDGLNIEQSTTSDFVAETQVGGISSSNNSFYGVHLESFLGAGAKYFDIKSGDGWVFDNVWHSNPDDTGTLFSFDVSGTLTGYPIYILRNVRCNQPSTSFKMVNDVQRGISRTSQQAYRVIQELVSGVDTTAGWAREISGLTLGAVGGMNTPVMFGATTGIGFGSVYNSPRIVSGSGTPEGAVTASIGSLYLRTDGGASTSVYVKESGTGNAGWTAK